MYSSTLSAHPVADHPEPGVLEIDRHYLADEGDTVHGLLAIARISPDKTAVTQNNARELVEAARTRQRASGALHAFHQHYDLSSREGLALMNLAEALLRIPDAATADKLIADRLAAADWTTQRGASDSRLVNAATLALNLTHHMLRNGNGADHAAPSSIAQLLQKLETPVIRHAMKWGMQLMARQFVLGETMPQALQRSQEPVSMPYRYSFDMLGEAALTGKDAAWFLDAYREAILALGTQVAGDNTSLMERPSVSVKLSALCPRFEYAQRRRAVTELTGRLLTLAQLAREQGVALTVDAEEADRLSLTLEVFANVYRNPELTGWPGLGLAVQAYQKRTLAVIRWLDTLAAESQRTIPVRLVKGAYWDTEIKRAQEQGLRDYPVFTRKHNTDVSYLACARTLLDSQHLYPQFATHNAHTAAWIHVNAGRRAFEFQRLHGMGEAMYGHILEQTDWNVPCRIYAPVGSHKELLPYLVRRLLENGANSSFVNQVLHDDVDVENIIINPIAATELLGEQIRHPRILMPQDLYQPRRRNSTGLNFADPHEREPLLEAIRSFEGKQFEARPLIAGRLYDGKAVTVRNPADPDQVIGTTYFGDAATVKDAVDVAAVAFKRWNGFPAGERAAILERAADLFEEHRAELLYLCIREGGKTIRDSYAELREAVDFLRYYASECRERFSEPQTMPGPTGETNQLHLRGRGVFLCISPWNFPLAIFTGQVAAALAAGNSVIAKPPGQTSLVAARVTALLHEAGIPADVLNFLPGSGRQIGEICLPDPRVAGVAVTGSTETAQAINRTLAAREGPIATLIAETGGMNALIADNSTLPEQLVTDVIQSAFHSAGQRCSALRILFLPDQTADHVLELLQGATQELIIGDPMELETDVGPVIDPDAYESLDEHVNQFQSNGRLLHRLSACSALNGGNYFLPATISVTRVQQLTREVFGPVLHVIRYKPEELDQVIDGINSTGYGLTLGVHSRIDTTADDIAGKVDVGNVYINRNMVGAVVGTQPFGGCGLSGTGPKAGGPHYLLRFATEKTITVNTAAVGGNASLLTM